MTTVANLLGASRSIRRRHHRYLRKLKRGGTITYVPPAGAAVDLLSGGVTYELSGPQADVGDAARATRELARIGSAQATERAVHVRFRVLIAGRRFGKTHLACVEMITHGLEHPGVMIWYVAPTYAMAKDIAWDTLKALIPPWLLARKPNESRLMVTLVTGARIQLKGAEAYNRLRGRSLSFVVLDEFPMMDERVWTESIRPSLADSEGDALFIGTPMGFNWAYDLFLKWESTDADAGEWQSFQFTTEQGGRVTARELASAAALLDARIYRQEFQASFESLTGRLYSNFARLTHVDATVLDVGGMVYVGIDFNVNPMTAAIGVRDPKDVRTILVLYALEIPDANTDILVEKLRELYPRRVADPLQPGKTLPGRPVTVCPDPAGKARKTSAPVGVTDLTILERAGFLIDAPSQAPLVKDRINNVQANLRAADGTMRVRIHPRAVALIKALEGLTWVKNAPDPKSPLIHITDAFGYLLWQQFNLLDASGWRISRFEH